MFRKFTKYIPLIPATALVFCLLCALLWNFRLIPNPKEILNLLEDLYLKYGYFGLIIATFLESTVYLGLYFPGSVIIALAVFLSDGRFLSLFIISVLVGLTLTITATINYFLGRCVGKKSASSQSRRKTSVISKGLFASMLHPNLLAFYFFNAGIENQNFKKIFIVPFFMIPYGLLIGFLLSALSGSLRQGLESPTFIVTAVFLWFVASFTFEYRRRKYRKSN